MIFPAHLYVGEFCLQTYSLSTDPVVDTGRGGGGAWGAGASPLVLNKSPMSNIALAAANSSYEAMGSSSLVCLPVSSTVQSARVLQEPIQTAEK